MTSQEWSLARACYDGFKGNRKHCEFEDLEENEQRYWLAAARAVVSELTRYAL